MGRKLTIPYYRPTFVQKELSEVGDGTGWPMEATPDQVAEIFYRVKDAWFTSGSLNNVGEDSGTSSFVGAPTTDRLAGASEESYDYGSTVWVRGHCISDTPAVNSYLAYWAYYKVDENDGLKSSKFKAPYTLDNLGYKFYDVLDDEIGPWQTIIDPNTDAPPRFWDTCAFNHAFDCGHYPDKQPDYGIFSTREYGGQAFLSLKVGPSVAWVGGSGPFDPAARLFVEIEFFLAYDEEGNVLTSSRYVNGMEQTEISIKLVIKLHGEDNTCSCPLYAYIHAEGSDLVIEAKNWWPYAKADGSPVWDTATGEKL